MSSTQLSAKESALTTRTTNGPLRHRRGGKSRMLHPQSNAFHAKLSTKYVVMREFSIRARGRYLGGGERMRIEPSRSTTPQQKACQPEHRKEGQAREDSMVTSSFVHCCDSEYTRETCAAAAGLIPGPISSAEWNESEPLGELSEAAT